MAAKREESLEHLLWDFDEQLCEKMASGGKRRSPKNWYRELEVADRDLKIEVLKGVMKMSHASRSNWLECVNDPSSISCTFYHYRKDRVHCVRFFGFQLWCWKVASGATRSLSNATLVVAQAGY